MKIFVWIDMFCTSHLFPILSDMFMLKLFLTKSVFTIFSTVLLLAWDVFCCCASVWQQNLAAVLDKEERAGLVNGKEAMVHVPIISSATSATLKGLFMVLDFLYRDKCRSETKLRRQPDQNAGHAEKKNRTTAQLFCLCLQVCWRLQGGSAEELCLDEPGATRCLRRPGLLCSASPQTASEHSS